LTACHPARKVRAVSSIPACQVCGGLAAPYHQDSRGALYRCAACTFVFLHPIPSAAEQAGLYEAQGIGARYFPKAERKLARARGRMRRVQRFVPRGRFLDAGCNGGFMVEAARLAGFEAVGVEPDPASVAWAQEHFPANKFVVATLEQFAEARDGGMFDAVYTSEVIEHAPDANRFAAALASVMRPGAVLYLTTPDIGHWRRPSLARWDAYKPPEHCLYFTPKSLTQLLRKHRLEVVERAFAWKPGIKVIARRV
jgi:SAM-dependent methyltransferase